MGALAGKRIVVVGDAVVDTYLIGRTVRISREAPVLVVRKESQSERPGGAANVAGNQRIAVRREG